MNILTKKSRETILYLLLEGNSLRSTASIVGVSRNSVEKILLEVGRACLTFHNSILFSVSPSVMQCRVTWSFSCPVSNKEGSQGAKHDIWTWIAKDSISKAVTNWYVGPLDGQSCKIFVDDIRRIIAEDYSKITAVDNKSINSVFCALLGESSSDTIIDYSLLNLLKLYSEFSSSSELIRDPEVRISMQHSPEKICLWNKRIANYMYAISLHYMFHNFCRENDELGITPAMKAGVSKHIWELDELLIITA